jgi:hypothetical protein
MMCKRGKNSGFSMGRRKGWAKEKGVEKMMELRKSENLE